MKAKHQRYHDKVIQVASSKQVVQRTVKTILELKCLDKKLYLVQGNLSCVNTMLAIMAEEYR